MFLNALEFHVMLFVYTLSVGLGLHVSTIGGSYVTVSSRRVMRATYCARRFKLALVEVQACLYNSNVRRLLAHASNYTRTRTTHTQTHVRAHTHTHARTHIPRIFILLLIAILLRMDIFFFSLPSCRPNIQSLIFIHIGWLLCQPLHSAVLVGVSLAHGQVSSLQLCSIYLLFLFIYCYMKTVHCIFYSAGHWTQ